MFPQGEKPADIEALEERLNDLLKKQGRLVNEIKDLKKAKKKLMDSIVAGMEGSSARDNRKKENQQRLLLEEIRTLQAELTDKKEFRENLEESMDSAYSLMHGLLGHDIMNLFDKGKFRP